MLKKFILSVSILLICLLLFVIYKGFFVKFSTVTWEKKFKLTFAAKICGQFFNNPALNKILKEHNISNEKCSPLAHESLNRCMIQYSSKVPSQMTVYDGYKWGKKLGECAGGDFYDHYVSE